MTLFPQSPAPDSPTAQQVRDALARYRMPVTPEAALQGSVERALREQQLSFTREVRRDADRIDFLVGSVGVELKVKGSAGDVLRQLERYAAWDEITELLLVTSKGAHRALPDRVSGKRLLIHIPRGVF